MKPNLKKRLNDHYDRLAEEEDAKRQFYSSEKDPKNVLKEAKPVPVR
jgi:hypothetical protein